ncbi:hypothetical protein OAH96_00230 [Candidatus Pelagibacter sp.]|nr:hypothetical protein [Candidatus Pelagibacter sp.]MDC1246033.1 hypothetical protein [Pelagibacteraceae bacterium]|tara:strand:+ start:49 stop:858 length:810 start_codon:yes stop_codon:yes gene_type:complete
MFISDRLCFLELGKTGCSYIREVLSENIPQGNLTHIHDTIDSELLNSNRFFLGSIRNPFDWYVSLWAFGCLHKKKDPLYSNLTSRRINPFRLSSINKNYLKKIKFISNQLIKNVGINKKLYSDPLNVDNFREWIKMILKKKNKNQLGEHYAISNTNKFIGYMTFHYLLRFIKPNKLYMLFNNEINNYEDLKNFDKNFNFIMSMLKFESIDQDLINIFNKLNIPINKTVILQKKAVNKSVRLKNTMDYYNDETIKIVRQNDSLIFEKYRY